MSKPAAIEPPVDFLIITPLPEERAAVLERLRPYRKLPLSPDDVRIYYGSHLNAAFSGGGKGRYKVVVASPLDMGRVEAATATADAIRLWRPEFVLLVGIAGGLARAGVKLGDILIAEQIVDYELQKLTPGDERIRWKTHAVAPQLLEAAKHFTDDRWVRAIAAKRPVPGAPERRFGAIATGDKVIANDWMEKHRGVWDRLVGVEMEAGGTAIAASQSANSPRFFMIRGVSDLADGEKDTAGVVSWWQYACEVAASFAIALLRTGPVLPVGGATRSPRPPASGAHPAGVPDAPEVHEAAPVPLAPSGQEGRAPSPPETPPAAHLPGPREELQEWLKSLSVKLGELHQRQLGAFKELVLRRYELADLRIWEHRDPERVRKDKQEILVEGERYYFDRSEEVRREVASWNQELSESRRKVAELNEKRKTPPSGLIPVLGCHARTRVGDVIFVHGLGGHAETSWCHEGRPDCFWPHWLGASIPEVGVWTYGYETPRTWSNAKGRLGFLKDVATRTLANLDARNLGDRPLVFVAHCFGGVLIKEMLRIARESDSQEWKAIDQATRGIVFISTPHSADDLPAWSVSIEARETREVLKDLSSRVTEWNDLDRWFGENSPPGVECQVYSSSDSPFGALALRRQEGDQPRPARPPIPLTADHLSSCKPASREELLVTRTVSLVQRCFKLSTPTQSASVRGGRE